MICVLLISSACARSTSNSSVSSVPQQNQIPDKDNNPIPTSTLDPHGKSKAGEAMIEISYTYSTTTDTGRAEQKEEGKVSFNIMKYNVPKYVGPNESPQKFILDPEKKPGSIQWTDHVDAAVCGYDADASGTIEISGTLDDSDLDKCRLYVTLKITYGTVNMISKNCSGGLVPYQLEPYTYGPLEFPLVVDQGIEWDMEGGGKQKFTLRRLIIDQEKIACQFIAP